MRRSPEAVVVIMRRLFYQRAILLLNSKQSFIKNGVPRPNALAFIPDFIALYLATGTDSGCVRACIAAVGR